MKRSYDERLEIVNEKITEAESKAQEELNNLKERANLQLRIIEQQAHLETMNSIRANIQSELASPRVQQMISSELTSNVLSELDELTMKSFGKASDRFESYAEQTARLVVDYQLATLWSTKSKIIEIDSIAVSHPDKRLSEFAETLRKEIAQFHIQYIDKWDSSIRPSIQFRKRYKITELMSDDELTKFLLSEIYKINDEQDPVYIAECFIVLSDLYNITLGIFEFQKLKEIQK